MRISFYYIFPVIIFVALVLLLQVGLNRNSTEPVGESSKNSVLSNIKQSRRTFKLLSLVEPNKELTQEIFLGKVTVLNVWASWCTACRLEQDLLVSIAKETGAKTAKTGSLSFIGLNINDSVEDAQRMLQIYGNPYQEILYDPEGSLAVQFGIRGTPALLILDKNAGIQYRHYGPINPIRWKTEILPLIQDLQARQG